MLFKALNSTTVKSVLHYLTKPTTANINIFKTCASTLLNWKICSIHTGVAKGENRNILLKRLAPYSFHNMCAHTAIKNSVLQFVCMYKYVFIFFALKY